MSSPIWTPDALSSEARPLSGPCWRLVEAQHRVSTLKLVDTLEEQSLLEALVDATKPTVPVECRHLDYLLSTPFRYGSAYPVGSRFRRAGRTPGVYYASETVETAVAEMAFYRLLFFAESPATAPPENATEFTAFSAMVASRRALDLTLPPLDSHRAQWTAAADYRPCQDLADMARTADLEVIRYQSVRDPAQRANLALLQCRVFSRPRPVDRQSWRLRITPGGVQALCEAPQHRLSFALAAFAGDPRLAAALEHVAGSSRPAPKT